MAEPTLYHEAPAIPQSPIPRWERIFARIQVMVTLASLAPRWMFPVRLFAEQWASHFRPRFRHDVDYVRFAVEDWGTLLAEIGLVLGVFFLIVAHKRAPRITYVCTFLCVINWFMAPGQSL
jgi:hypothetical protein